MKLVKEAAQAAQLELQLLEAKSANDFSSAFSVIAKENTKGVLVLAEPVFESNFPALARLALEHRLVSVGARNDFVPAGGLVSYGTNFPELYRRAASYVHKILKGARPDELPVEQPVVFDLTINLKTARALDIVLPASLITRADEVIE
jgi:putative tryptophan/tyrosine transport system substrate-binding protein